MKLQFATMLMILQCLPLPAMAANGLDTLLQKGLFEEEANQNLPEAIKAYEAVVAKTDEQRRLAATAVFRLGECYRKLGKTNEAVGYFDRIVREFSDQQNLVTSSQKLLAELRPVSTNVPPRQPGRSVADFAGLQQENQEIQRLTALLRDSPDLVNALDSQHGRAPLHNAARDGQVRLVSFLLTNGANIELRERYGRTPLLEATMLGHKEIVDLLLAHKAQVNAANNDRWTPAHYAAAKGQKAILESLIKAGANVNAGGQVDDVIGTTPLHIAASRAYMAVVELLLANKANVNAQNQQGRTPLDMACATGYAAIAEVLVKNSANINARDSNRKTALHYAVGGRHGNVAEFLLQRNADVNARDSEGLTPLHYAIRDGHLGITQILLKHKADVNVASSSGSTPLMMAAEKQSLELTEMLLAAGTDVNAGPSNAGKPLHQAVYYQSMAILEKLLAAKPQLEVRDHESYTPLHRAVARGYEDGAKLLLEAGADPNSTLPSGQTPLHLAVQNQFSAITELLLAHKADPNIVDQRGRAPIDLVKPPAAYNPQIPPMPAQPGGVQLGAPSVPSRAWRQPVPGQPQPVTASPDDLAELLIKHGADTNMQRRSTISVARNQYSTPIFMHGGNVHNRFTLFELIANSYSHPQAPNLPFPDFSRVTIERLNGTSGATRLKIDAAKLLKEGECSKDPVLQWGDIVNIPEQEHQLGANWEGFESNVVVTLSNCLQRTVYVVIKGETNELSLRPYYSPTPQYFRIISPTFWLVERLHGSKLLLTTSDLERVKVHRHDPASGKVVTTEWPAKSGRAQGDLWLRNGDIIEVPEIGEQRAAASGKDESKPVPRRRVPQPQK